MSEPDVRGKTIVVMPAYNAANTLERIYADIPLEIVDEVIVVDDQSSDDTVAIARKLPVKLIVHERNTGYGGNQKTCYREALARGAEYVVMLHADYQYDARMIPACERPRMTPCARSSARLRMRAKRRRRRRLRLSISTRSR